MELDLVTMLAVSGVAGLAWAGWTLTAAIWDGNRPRALWIAAAMLFAALACSMESIASQQTDATLIAGVAAAEQPCLVGSRLLEQQLTGQHARLIGTGAAATACGLWAMIEDPRTGSLWLQGPATGGSNRWTMDLVLGSGDAESLLYRVSLLAVSPETNQAWLDLAEGQAPLSLGAVPLTRLWIARDLPVSAGAPK